MYKSILVPYDGSEASARSLPIAVSVAQRTNASVCVAVVHDPSSYIPFAPGEVAIPVYNQEIVESHRKHDQEILEAAVEQLRDRKVQATGVLLEGTIVEALEEHVISAGIDLTIMGTHGRTGFERLRLGSVATAFLTRSTTPVLLTPAREGPAPEVVPGGVLLCPLDGSPFAEEALPHANTLADALGLHMHLIAVAVPHAIPMAPFGAEALLADSHALEAEVAGRETYLARIAAGYPSGTTWSVITDMSVARGLQDAAGDMKASAIAIATHGRGGLKRLVLGSVTDELLRNADIPILVYRPRK